MKYALFCISSLFLITLGCSEKESIPQENLGTEDHVSAIAISSQGVAKASEEADDLPLVPGEAQNLVGYNEFTSGNLIYISQLGTERDPNFSNSPSSNFYIYQYQENSEADWDNEYNFVPYNEAAIKWSFIKAFGSVGNAFSLYAMSFPGVTASNYDPSLLNFEVKTDQTGGEENAYDPTNFNNSDILGAYHATSALFTRLRFNLFHLMVQLKITIYAPVFESTADPDDNYSYSGFKEKAMLAGYLLNAQNQFNISWRANRSSDTEPPLTLGTGNKTNLKMYMYEPSDEVLTIENIKQYFPSSTLSDDNVRAYNFSILFPAQTFNPNDNLLCFVLEGAVNDNENNYKYYYFSANQIVSGTYALNQGTLQHLYLYIPRTSNETILVGAKILNWGNSSSDMTVSQEKDNINSDDVAQD